VDLSPGQQRAVFFVVVVVLAAVGYLLVAPRLTHSHAASQPTVSPTPAAPSTSAPPVTTAPTETATPTTAGGVNIYAWLPFTQQDLAAAASVATRFGVAYNTYSYTENATGYVNAMGGLVTEPLATTLRAAYSIPGVAQLRTEQKQVSTGTAVINSLRGFGPSSMIFIVTLSQHLVTNVRTSDASSQWAITVTGAGTTWQASDIEPAKLGNS
jgi:hypothetical protein